MALHARLGAWREVLYLKQCVWHEVGAREEVGRKVSTSHKFFFWGEPCKNQK